MADTSVLTTAAINLAREAPFRLGDVEVYPSTRQVAHGELRETLEPRVMQVLVCLAQAHGAIVDRDELTQRCWGGVVVGENAIHRAISRVREVAQAFGPGAFQVETISKVGYRLSPANEPESTVGVAQSPAAEPPRIGRRSLLAVGAAAVMAAGAGAAVLATRRTDGAARKLYLQARDAQQDGSYDQARQAVADLQQAVAAAPDFAEAWGALAVAYVQLAPASAVAQQPRLIDHARSAAERALQLDADNPDALVARALLRPSFGRWGEAELALRRLSARFPRHGFLHLRLADLLQQVGRPDDAANILRRNVAADAYRAQAAFGIAACLWAMERLDEAQAALESNCRRWPGNSEAWWSYVNFLTFTGRPEAALGLIEDRSLRPSGHDDGQYARAALLARALQHGTSGAAEQVMAFHAPSLRKEAANAVFSVPEAVALGRIDTAFAELDAYLFNRGALAAPQAGPVRPTFHYMTDFLFSHPVKPLRADPRLGPVLRGIGLEAYWRASGSTPHFRRPR